MDELKELEYKLRREYELNKSWKTRLAENFIGGVSLAIALYFSYIIATSSFSFDEWLLYANIGLAAFGTINCIRFFSDELSIPATFYHLGAASKSIEIAYLKHQLDKNNPVPNSYKTDEINKTAMRLIKLFYSGYDIGREACAAHGISSAQWNQARELLVRAGIVNTAKSKRTELISPTYTEAKQKLMEILE
jgi:hypothetical protein